MARNRTIIKMADSENPTIQVGFKGKYKKDYFEIHRLSVQLKTTGTNLARQIMHDWLRMYDSKSAVMRVDYVNQLKLSMDRDVESPAKKPGVGSWTRKGQSV